MFVLHNNNSQTLRSPDFPERSKQNNQYKKFKYAVKKIYLPVFTLGRNFLLILFVCYFLFNIHVTGT
jgi:hypothetical protein